MNELATSVPQGAPLPVWRGAVESAWVDYNGHLRDAYYLLIFSLATDALMDRIGLDEAGRAATGHSLFTLECHLNYLHEVKLGTVVEVRTQVLALDAKRLHIFHTLHLADVQPGGADEVLASNEKMLLNVELIGPNPSPFKDSVLFKLQQIAQAQAALPKPKWAGRSIALPQPTRTPRVTTPFEGVAHTPWDDSAPIAAPLRLYDTVVSAEWVDYNAHMSESCYLLVFGNNSDAFFRYIGIDEAYRAAGHSLYSQQTLMHHVKEVAQGEPLRLSLQLLDADAKRVHTFHTMHHARSGELLATAEQMLVHVDMQAGRSAPMPTELHARLQAILKAHAGLGSPKQARTVLGIRRG